MKRHKQQKKNSVPLLLFALALLCIVFLGLFLRFQSAGKAVYTTVPLGPIDLTTAGEHAVDINAVSSFQLLLKPSSVSSAQTYDVTLTKNADGSVIYTLRKGSEILSLGRVASTLPSSGNIFLDNDFIPDIKFTLGGNLLSLNNLNFVQPQTSDIKIQELSGTTWTNPSTKKLIYVPLNSQSSFRLQISSAEAAPTASLIFADATASKTFVEVPEAATSTSKTYQLEFTPTVKKAYVATVTATVGGKVSTKDFVFAGDGLLYQLDQANYPKVNLTIDAANQGRIGLTFEPSLSLQSFSLPCSISPATLSSVFDTSKLKAVYTYKSIHDASTNTDSSKVLSWINTVGDLAVVEPNLGYALKLKEATSYYVTLNCISNYDFNQAQQPSLRVGWNFVSVTGYLPVPVSSLSAPPTQHVSTVYLLKKDQAYEAAAQLEPGKAYWVLVE